MADYRVNLDIFAGPLDLLLYLVRREEVDIYDIPIARITQQYLAYVEMLKSLDIDLAGDFLVMAATLMHIKSAMLLPQTDTEGLDSDDLADPRAELIRQLLEYKKFKDAANLLGASADEAKSRFARPAAIIERLKGDAEPAIDIEQVSVWNLLEAFDSVMSATGQAAGLNHITDETPIDLYQIEILHRLQSEGPMPFERIFESRPNRFVMTGLFLAILELIREKLIWAEQAESSDNIFMRALTEKPAEQAVRKAIIATAAELEQQQSAQTQQPKQPQIPIKEMPPQEAQTTSPDEQQQVPQIANDLNQGKAN